MQASIEQTRRGGLGLVGVALAFVLSALTVLPAAGGGLEEEVGRAETRVRSAIYPLQAGRTVAESQLLERLEQLGYERVRQRPSAVGQFFYGHEAFWIYRQPHRWRGRDYAASLIGLELRRSDGMILGALGVDGQRFELGPEQRLWLEPLTLAESIAPDRAVRRRVSFAEVPERVWQPILAAEDARFFDHRGVDARSIARAALANVKRRGVAQGGSTITQQLIKNRDLTPKRSLGRKTSEAIRALWLEAQFDKEEILQAYLNQLYLGHVDGLAIHGLATAAHIYFSKSPDELNIAESAALAAMIQGPNRLDPQAHPQRLRERRDWVLSRLEELGWASSSEIRQAQASAVQTRINAPRLQGPPQFLSAISQWVGQRHGKKGKPGQGRGVIVETTLDPWLQLHAETVVADQLRRLRQQHQRLRGQPLAAALVALDAASGDVLAYVGGDPQQGGDRFDRVRQARRQPGSTVKPFVMLEALDRCGRRAPLNAATPIADERLQWELPSGVWEPDNADGRYLPQVSLRQALEQSRNVPTVRVARWCGVDAVSGTFRKLGLELPAEAPPAFALGAVETSPFELARAYTVLASPGVRIEPRLVGRLERPGGGALARPKLRRRRVVRPASAYLVRHLLEGAVARGTAQVGQIEGAAVAAKTGTSSDARDAWFAGHAGSVVTVVWVGLDDGKPLGLSGAQAAGPLWQRFMEAAVATRPKRQLQRPAAVVTKTINAKTGLRVPEGNRRATPELFRRGVLPPVDRFWRRDRHEVIR